MTSAKEKNKDGTGSDGKESSSERKVMENFSDKGM